MHNFTKKLLKCGLKGFLLGTNDNNGAWKWGGGAKERKFAVFKMKNLGFFLFWGG